MAGPAREEAPQVIRRAPGQDDHPAARIGRQTIEKFEQLRSGRGPRRVFVERDERAVVIEKEKKVATGGQKTGDFQRGGRHASNFSIVWRGSEEHTSELQSQ